MDQEEVGIVIFFLFSEYTLSILVEERFVSRRETPRSSVRNEAFLYEKK